MEIKEEILFAFKYLIMIYKIQQNRYTAYPKISAKRDFSPVFVLILKYVVCEFCPFMMLEIILLAGSFREHLLANETLILSHLSKKRKSLGK